MKIKSHLEKFFSHPIFNFFISLIIIGSIILLFLQKLIDFSPPTYMLIERIDFIIVIIFTLEFILKSFLWKFSYFFKDYGWVDFLSILPIFTPALRSIRGVKIIRSIRTIRLLRLLRVIRILKIPHYYKYSRLKQNVFIPTSALIMIIVLVTGYLFINQQEDLLIKHQREKLKNILQSSDITKNKNLLQIRKGNDVIFQKFDENIYKIFLFEYITHIDYKGLTYTFSLKNIYHQLNQFELRIIIISFISMFLLILSLNFIIDKTILNPIINIEKKINKIVTVKKVPLSGDHRITLDFSQNINYAGKDEIGNIAKSFNNLLFLLKKQQKFSKNALTNICSTVMNILEHYHSITRGHSYRTALIATAIATQMGFKDDELENIFHGSILHDIGKISVNKECFNEAR